MTAKRQSFDLTRLTPVVKEVGQSDSLGSEISQSRLRSSDLSLQKLHWPTTTPRRINVVTDQAFKANMRTEVFAADWVVELG